MLTDMQCRKAELRTKPYKLGDGQGLYLHVTPNGSKHWRFKYRYGGREKLMAFGPYPLISLAEARAKRDEARKMVVNGFDPAALKKESQQEEQRKAQMTFARVAREWHELYKDRWSVGHAATIMHRMETDIFPHIGDHPVHAISPSLLLSVVRKIEARGAHEMARRATQI